MKHKSVISIILALIAGFLWLAWISLRYTQDHVDSLKEAARTDLVALNTKVDMTPGRHIIEYFNVHYDSPHYIGLNFYDRALSDSLEKYIGWFNPPDFGLNVSWTLYEDKDSLAHHSLKYSTGSSGNTLMFDEFNAQTGRKYKLDLLVSSLPKFASEDSAYLEVGVSRAAISVGNEFFYGLLGAIAKSLSTPILWSAIAVSALTLLYLLRRRIKHVNGN